jgi:hypothetical protein
LFCSRRLDAARRLGLDSLARIDPLATHVVRAAGSKAQFSEYARLSDQEDVRGLVGKWDTRSPSDRQALTIADLCAACNLLFPTLLGKVTAAAYEHNYDVSGLLAAVNQPEMVSVTVKSALVVGPEGMADRKMLLTHSNFLPVRKGTTAIFDLRQQVNNAHEDRDGEPTSLPRFESDIIAFSSAQWGKTLPTAVNPESRGEQPAEGTGMSETSRNLAGWCPAETVSHPSGTAGVRTSSGACLLQFESKLLVSR